MKNKILQFGEGNFMRCFVEYKMQMDNNTKGNDETVTVITPIDTGITRIFERQNCEYNVALRGKNGGMIVDELTHVTVINKVINPFEDFAEYKRRYMEEDLGLIITNTTEAGIVYNERNNFDDGINAEFPAKVTHLLYDRFNRYKTGGGVTFLCIELIDNNAEELKKCILKYAAQWKLPDDFIEFVENNNSFCSTLVDRVVSGFPKDNKQEFFDRLGYEDNLLTVGEPYFLWIIKGNRELANVFPFLDDEHILFTDNLEVFRERKVRILNGMHTMTVPIALLSGVESVGEAMKNGPIRGFLNEVLANEILPNINQDRKMLNEYAASVFERFENPFIYHSFWSISLNSISKWRTRDLCSLDDYYQKNNTLPKGICFSLAALYVFYTEKFSKIKDTCDVIGFFENKKRGDNNKLHDFLAMKKWWGKDLTEYNGLFDYVEKAIDSIYSDGIIKSVEKYTEL